MFTFKLCSAPNNGKEIYNVELLLRLYMPQEWVKKLERRTVSQRQELKDLGWR